MITLIMSNPNIQITYTAMGPLVLALGLVLVCFQPLRVRAQSSSTATDLDARVQQYAYASLPRPNPKTGTIYSANAAQLPSNLTGIGVAALRLRSGSLRRKGFKKYNEFQIPKGVVEKPYVERLVLVYQNLGNRSSRYYPLPNYIYLAPVLGLLAYDASNLSATNLAQLDINASGDPILVKFQNVKSPPPGTVPVATCVRFDSQGLPYFSIVTGVNNNTCSTSRPGHFSIVVKIQGGEKQTGNRNRNRVWIVVGCAVGGVALLLLLSCLLLWMRNFKQRKRMQRMETAADAGEALRVASVGNTKAPAATVTRTQPTLEPEYAPSLSL